MKLARFRCRLDEWGEETAVFLTELCSAWAAENLAIELHDALDFPDELTIRVESASGPAETFAVRIPDGYVTSSARLAAAC